MARMKKVDLVAKIAKEQNLDPEKLERLSMTELEKMDKVVPDGQSSGQESSKSSDSSPSSSSSASDDEEGSDILGSDPEAPVVAQDPVSDAQGKVIGNHPVTGEPVLE